MVQKISAMNKNCTLVIAQFRVQYYQFFPSLLYFANFWQALAK